MRWYSIQDTLIVIANISIFEILKNMNGNLEVLGVGERSMKTITIIGNRLRTMRYDCT